MTSLESSTKEKIFKVLDFQDGIFGKIYIKYNSHHHSTHSFMKNEFRCYIERRESKTYLTSFDSPKKANYYLKNLFNHRYKG